MKMKWEESGRRTVCAENGLCIGYMYFKHITVHNNIMMARGEDGVNILLLVKRDMLRYVHEVKGMGRALSIILLYYVKLS